MLELIEYMFLGILQGITEPIPVSSSGHILILQEILEKFNSTINIDFSTLAIITNLGSFLAILVIYWNDIVKLVKSFFTFIFNKQKREAVKDDYSYCWKIVIATIPVGIMGLIATKFDLLTVLEENVKFIGLMLIVTALFLYLIKDFKGVKNNKGISYKDSLIIGLYQMVSVIPGISRSGATIVGCMFQGLKRNTAFDFAFILYIPVSIATSLLGIKDLMEMSLETSTLILYLIATIMAFIFTYIFTILFRKIVKEGKLMYFSIYCLILGLLVIVFL